MNAPPSFHVRRATTDDLPQLMALWKVAQFASDDLERRFTEFVVAASREGEVIGAVGLQISGSDGLIHSETFSDFGWSDTVRPRLWEHIQTIAQGHTLFRLWTQESAPFWKKDAGFGAASVETLNRLPEAFGARRAGWLTLRLKDELADPALLEAQFAQFRQAEQARRERLLARAHALKIFGTFLAAALFVYLFAAFVAFLRKRRHTP